MNLKRAATLGAKRAMRTANSIREWVTLVQTRNQTYNATTGKMSVGTSEDPKALALLTKYSLKEIESEGLQPEDERCTIEVRTLPTGYVIKVQDRILRTSGEWRVQKAKLDGTNTLWILALRHP